MPPRNLGAESVTIAAARAKDRDFFLAVRNETSARRNSFSTNIIDPATHRRWFSRALRNHNAKLYRILAGKTSAGILRANRTDFREAELHIALLPEWRGRGVAAAAIRTLLAKLGRGDSGWRLRRVFARIKKGNTASIELFKGLGFAERGSGKNKLCFERSMDRSSQVVFVIDGGPEIGMGHLTRAVALSRELRPRRFECGIFCRQGASRVLGLRRLVPKGIRILTDGADLRSADAVVIDTLTLPSEAWIRRYILHRTPVLLVGSYLAVPHWAHVCVNPYTRPRRAGPNARVLGDPAYTVLASDFASARLRAERRRTRPNAVKVLVFTGGGNTRGMLFRVLDALKALSPGRRITVVAGGYFTGMKKLLIQKKGFGAALRIRKGLSAAQMAKLMAESDAAVLSLGRSCDEARAAGLPAFVLSSSELNRLGALKMQKDGGILYGGDIRKLPNSVLQYRLELFLRDAKKRARLSRSGMRTIDGRGGERVARLIAQYAKGKR